MINDIGHTEMPDMGTYASIVEDNVRKAYNQAKKWSSTFDNPNEVLTDILEYLGIGV